jgi:multimeric flavodoxin WrbA
MGTTLNICIISGSTRNESASLNVSNYVQSQFSELFPATATNIFDLSKLNLPMWDEDTDVSLLSEQKQQLADADAFVIVVPEWHGMVPPAVKNLFFLFSGVFRHKPAYLICVSSGTGGRYPLAEMRSSTYKNSFINYIPVNTIIDRVNTVISPEGEYIAEKEFVRKRVDEGVRLIQVYAEAFVSIRNSEIVQEKRFPNGV